VSFLSVVAALVGRAGVRGTACVGARKRAVFDYRGVFSHLITLKYSNDEIGFVGIGVFVIIVAFGIRTYWAWKNTVYHIEMCCYVMFICLGNRAFNIVGGVGHGSFEDYHTEIVCCYVHFVRSRIFVVVGFAGHWNSEYWHIGILSHLNSVVLKYRIYYSCCSCIRIRVYYR
jgi:hypothetical protein